MKKFISLSLSEGEVEVICKALKSFSPTPVQKKKIERIYMEIENAEDPVFFNPVSESKDHNNNKFFIKTQRRTISRRIL